MATVDVNFDFLCTTASLRYTHPIPATLVNDTATAKTSFEYQQLFARTMLPIVKEHHDECFADSPRVCTNCDGVATHALMTPSSYLHLSPPRATVFVSPTCRSSRCETAIRAEIHATMLVVAKTVSAEPPFEIPGAFKVPVKESLACGLCGSCERTLKCSGCGIIAYCSKEHQHKHWKTHKPVCTGKKRASAD